MRRIRADILVFTGIFLFITWHPALAGQFFYINRPKLAFDLAYEYTHEKRKGNNINSVDTKHDFVEAVKIETQGWVYHPALLDFTLGLEPKWSQTTEDHSSGSTLKSSDADTEMLGYYLDASIFQFKPYTLQFFTRQQDYDLNSSFAQRSNTRTKTYGGNLFLKYLTLPTSIGYIHNDSKQTGFYTSSSNADEVRLNMRLPRENNKTDFTASFVDKKQDTNGIQTDIETLNTDIQNRLEFSNTRRRSLLSSAAFRQTQGTRLNNTTISFNQNLSWQHSDALNSNLNTHYNNSESGEFKNDTKSIGAGLSYHISDNLRTGFSSEASDRGYPGGNEREFGGRISCDFRHQSSIGVFALNTGHGYKLRNKDATDEFLTSVNEPVTLNTTQLVFLDQKNIVSSSVIVTNAASTVVYQLNTDYTLTEQLPYLRISRNPLGAIADGETVLVTYQYKNPSQLNDALYNQTYGVTYSPFPPLSFFYQYAQSEQIYRSGTAPDTLDKSMIHTAEASMDLNWSRTRLTYQDTFKSQGSSNIRYVAEQTLSYLPSGNLFAMVSASYGKTKFEQYNEIETFYMLKSQIDYAPSRLWKFSIEAFRSDISGDATDTLDHGVSTTFNIFYGIWNTSLEYVYIHEQDRASDETRQLNNITFKISRSLW